MKRETRYVIVISTILTIVVLTFIYTRFFYIGPPDIISAIFNPKKVNISLYWKNDKGELYSNIGALKTSLEKQNSKLIFATNGGMYDKSYRPIGLYIQNHEMIKPLNTNILKPDKNGNIPNFYLQPNGVFYITTFNEVGICQTSKFPEQLKVKYATQSGPMLLIDSEINTIFDSNSENYNIRNGVGIRPNNELVFAISKNKVTFYALAKYFKDQGCTNALFLDGYVSKAFLPEKNLLQMDGELSVLIGITENK
jgi:uncharacterized protein YigE (DUF2233 family)